MQKIGEILNAATQPTPAATTRRASRPQTTSTAYNELAEWANDAVNAKSWRIRPELALAEESEEQFLTLVAENNRRLREVRQQIATNMVEKSLKRHRFETLEIIAAHLKVRAAAVGSSAGKLIEWPDWSDPDIETASVPASEIGGPRGRGIPFPAIDCHTIGQTDGGRIVLGRIGSIGSKPVVLCRCSSLSSMLSAEERSTAGLTVPMGSQSHPPTNSSKYSEICTTDAPTPTTKTSTDTVGAGSASALSGAVSTPLQNGRPAAATPRA